MTPIPLSRRDEAAGGALLEWSQRVWGRGPGEALRRRSMYGGGRDWATAVARRVSLIDERENVGQMNVGEEGAGRQLLDFKPSSW